MDGIADGSLYAVPQPDDGVSHAPKLMTHEADVCRTHLKELRQDLAAFEQQYGLNSDEFYRRFQAGQTDDRMDYVEWASLVQMTENLQARLQLLTKA